MSEDLAQRRCQPCEGGVEPLSREQSEQLLEALHDDWSLSDDGLSIERDYDPNGNRLNETGASNHTFSYQPASNRLLNDCIAEVRTILGGQIQIMD